VYLGIRVFFAVISMLGVAWFFVFNNFVREIKPIAREVMEEVMVDAAHLLAELATDELVAGRIGDGRFALRLKNYQARQVDANIWGVGKDTLDFQVLVTDARGTVVFDSAGKSVGQDYSAWNDIKLTLAGEYGARATREVQDDSGTSVYYVAAPIRHNGVLVGVLSVSKQVLTIMPFIERAEQTIRRSGAWMLAWTLLIGVLVTLWTVYEVRRLARYAADVEAGKRVPLPPVRGELGKLAQAMASMRDRLEGQDYVERYVTALTHELKSPLAAIRASGELLAEPLAEADRTRFAGHVVTQSERMQRTVEQLLELTRLEHTQLLASRAQVDVLAMVRSTISQATARADAAGVRLSLAAESNSLSTALDRELIGLALSNLIDNAIAFSPADTVISVSVTATADAIKIAVQDAGPGVLDAVLGKLGQRFVSTPRPNGAPKSSGLGLAIVTQIVALHDGTFTLENNATGALAVMRLPR
jgi:two-component system, OmpR family, sensor histidine kinase CreC